MAINMIRSYYTPPGTQAGIGTRGTQRDMVVINHWQKKIWGIIGGAIAWEVATSGYPRAMKLFDGVLYVGDGALIRRLNPATGVAVGTPWTMNKSVMCMDITQQQNPIMIVGYADSGAGNVQFFNISSGSPVLQGTVQEPLSFPRGVCWVGLGGVIAVADTYLHNKLKYIHLSTGQLATVAHNQFDFHYPNDVQHIAGTSTSLVTAEHENRIIKVNYNTGARELIFAPNVAPYNDVTKTMQDIIDHEPNSFITAGQSIIYNPPKQAVAREYAGDITCYAPNRCFFGSGADAGKLIMCDTDNHRIVIWNSTGAGFNDWSVETEVVGVDMPVNVVLL